MDRKRKSKYKELNDREWLYEQYHTKKLSASEIGRIVGCKVPETVWQSLKSLEIASRSTRPKRVTGKSAYELLNNKFWLENQYIEQRKSTIEIGNIAGCCAGVVFKSLKRHGIKVRDRSWGHRIKRNDNFIFDIPVIEGSLLGDASIAKTKSGNNPLVKNNINYDHILFFANKIFSKDAEKRIRGPITRNNGSSTFRGKIYKNQEFYAVSSLRHPELKIIRDRWYPDGEKIIPRDITLTKDSLLHWFLDDGYSYYVTRHKKVPKWTKTVVRVQFATQSFKKEDLDFLCKKIFDLFKIKITPRIHRRHGVIQGYGYFLEISETQTRDFFDLIGPPPVPSLAYKWKII